MTEFEQWTVNFSYSVSRYNGLLERIKRLLKIGTEEAGDGLNNVLSALWSKHENGDPLDHIENFDMFVIGAVKNYLIDEKRRARRFSEFVENKESKKPLDENRIDEEGVESAYEADTKGMTNNNFNLSMVEQIGIFTDVRYEIEKFALEYVNHMLDDTDSRILRKFYLEGKSFKEIKNEFLTDGIEKSLGSLRKRKYDIIEETIKQILKKFPEAFLKKGKIHCFK